MIGEVAHIFRRGIPTANDVAKLMAFDAKPGMVIGYGQVETIIGVRADASRFRTVTNAWRKRMFREHQLRIIARGRTFIALKPDECLTQSVMDVNRNARAVVRTGVYVEAIDSTQLSSADRDRHMLLQRHAAALVGHAQSVRRAIALPKAIAVK